MSFDGRTVPTVMSDGSEAWYVPIINAATEGERIITPSGVTGAQSGDSGLSLPDATAWLSGAQGGGQFFSAAVSGAVVTQEFITDQGITFSPAGGVSSFFLLRHAA